ncbi:hypothetical protein MTBBW1_350063 [Desulfamplus magnetovallimortis]|uniref:Acyl-CoA thioesterase-like N-terminal HotDog domain-containing protein n=1 Tax=Desulfamplus magnetovallimortis TaxID=1246637 RepID=A0A1W1HGR3_9BACT|nr:thioesterase family protein [Desulfamplus magnetovallimortis]SLM31572.1 hypothetical protein MTBBW1_350063 [Desulfamplus magnetovallimortis]
MTDTSFATLIDKVTTITEEECHLVPDDWMQGRTVYGGLLVAMVLRSMNRHVPQERKVRSLLFSFIGPLKAEPFFIKTQILRSGKSVTTIEAKVIQNDVICSNALGSFGADRDSKILITPMKKLEIKDTSKAIKLPYIEGLTPAFTRHFDYRWAIGDYLFLEKAVMKLEAG